MRVKFILLLGVAFLAFRVLLGAFYVAVQASSPEGDMLIMTDVPALALEFLSAKLFGWPAGIVDAYDKTFHLFGLVAWFCVGCLLATIAEAGRQFAVRNAG